MCGIIHAINFDDKKEPINDWIIEQYQNQYLRGENGFGAVFVNDDGSWEVKRATTEAKILIDITNHPCRHIMFHHRSPTSSSNQLSQTHPFLVDNSSLKHKYLLIHNGVVTNAIELKQAHEKLGFIYASAYQDSYGIIKFNDSEALAIEMAYHIEKQTKEIEAAGNLIFSCLQIDKKTNRVLNVYFGSNKEGYGLNLAMTRGKFRLSSEGEGEAIADEKLYQFSMETRKLTKAKLAFKPEPNRYAYEWEGGGNGFSLETEDKVLKIEEMIAEMVEEVTDPTYGFGGNKDGHIKQITASLSQLWDECEKEQLDRFAKVEDKKAKKTNKLNPYDITVSEPQANPRNRNALPSPTYNMY